MATAVQTAFADRTVRLLLPLKPRSPADYYYNGAVTLASGPTAADKAAAARAFMRVLSIFERPSHEGDPALWARAVTGLYAMLTQPGADAAPRPAASSHGGHRVWPRACVGLGRVV